MNWEIDVLKKYLKLLALMICVSYTFVSVTGVIVNILSGTQINNFNTLLMFVTCVIASVVLSFHKLFDDLSPLMMMALQYLIACVLIGIMLFVINLFDEVTLKGCFEFYRSFTIPYAILAGFYYFSVFADAKKDNDLIKEIQEQRNSK